MSQSPKTVEMNPEVSRIDASFTFAACIMSQLTVLTFKGHFKFYGNINTPASCSNARSLIIIIVLGLGNFTVPFCHIGRHNVFVYIFGL